MKRMTLTIDDRTQEYINTLRDGNPMNTTDVIRRAVQLYAYLERERAAGNEVGILRRDGAELTVDRVLAFLD